MALKGLEHGLKAELGVLLGKLHGRTASCPAPMGELSSASSVASVPTVQGSLALIKRATLPGRPFTTTRRKEVYSRSRTSPPSSKGLQAVS